MSLRRQLLVSFGVQGAGAASVLLATFWLGASLGAEVQGSFSRSKSELEFVVAFAMFGLPQALFFYVKSGGLAARAALRWALGSALLAAPIGGLYALWQHGAAGALPWVLGAAVAACVAQGQLRALLLVAPRPTWFNAVTAAPQVLALIGVALVIGSMAVPHAVTWFALLGVASGLAALLASWRLGLRFGAAKEASVVIGSRASNVATVWNASIAPSAPSATSAATVSSASNALNVGWRALAHYGLAAWLTAALSTAAILAMQRWVETAEGRAALGRFTIAMTLVQVPLTPIAYAAPLLLRRWMERPGAAASRRWGARVFAALLVFAAIVGALATRWPDLGLGPSYAGATAALALLLVGGAAEAASRVLTVQASATGLPWVAVRAECLRWAVLALGWLAPLPGGLLPLCAVWAAAAIASAAVFVWHGRVGASVNAGAAA